MRGPVTGNLLKAFHRKPRRITGKSQNDVTWRIIYFRNFLCRFSNIFSFSNTSVYRPTRSRTSAIEKQRYKTSTASPSRMISSSSPDHCVNLSCVSLAKRGRMFDVSAFTYSFWLPSSGALLLFYFTEKWKYTATLLSINIVGNENKIFSIWRSQWMSKRSMKQSSNVTCL